MAKADKKQKKNKKSKKESSLVLDTKEDCSSDTPSLEDTQNSKDDQNLTNEENPREYHWSYDLENIEYLERKLRNTDEPFNQKKYNNYIGYINKCVNDFQKKLDSNSLPENTNLNEDMDEQTQTCKNVDDKLPYELEISFEAVKELDQATDTALNESTKKHYCSDQSNAISNRHWMMANLFITVTNLIISFFILMVLTS